MSDLVFWIVFAILALPGLAMLLYLFFVAALAILAASDIFAEDEK